MNLAIVGPGRSGKDCAADYLVENWAFRYAGSTSVVITREIAHREGISFDAAHEQRHARRDDWYRVGNEIRVQDPAFLVREVLKGGNLVVGVRDRCEMETARREGLIDLAIWVDREVPRDPTLGFGPDLADIVIQNHWDLQSFYARLDRLVQTFKGVKS